MYLLRATQSTVDIYLHGVCAIGECLAVVEDAYGHRLILVVHLTHCRGAHLVAPEAKEYNPRW